MATPVKVTGDRVLHPRSVLITGANRGIGLEMVKQLVSLPEPPTFIFATCRQPSQAKELQEIAKGNTSVKILEFDVTNFDRIPQLLEQLNVHVGDIGLNLLINNAGIAAESGFEGTSTDTMIEHYKVHVVGPFALTKGLLPLLRKAAGTGSDCTLDINRAAVVNVSSRMGSMARLPETIALLSAVAYRTAKASMTMLTRVMAIELAPAGVLAIALHPGWVQTEMGGKHAPVKPEHSVAGILRVLGNVQAEHAGLHIDFRGDAVDW